MAQLTLLWTDRAKALLRDILDFHACENREAARSLARRVFQGTDGLQIFPSSGRMLPEFDALPFRELIVPPCRVIYLVQETRIVIVTVIRSERLLRPELLEH